MSSRSVYQLSLRPFAVIVGRHFDGNALQGVKPIAT